MLSFNNNKFDFERTKINNLSQKENTKIVIATFKQFYEHKTGEKYLRYVSLN